MVAIVRLARVLLILALALLTVSFVVGVGTASTGLLEKVVLLALLVGSVYAAARVTLISDRIIHRIER